MPSDLVAWMFWFPGLAWARFAVKGLGMSILEKEEPAT